MPQLSPAPVLLQAREGNKASLVIFDFDGTLYSTDSFAAFLRWRILRSPLCFLMALLVLPGALLLACLPSSRRRYASLFTWIASVGGGEQGFQTLVAQFVSSSRNTLKYGGFYRDAVQCLHEHLAKGDTVIVATAAAEVLVAALMQREGLGNVPVLGSRLRWFCGGLVCDFHAYGENKLLHLRRNGYTGYYATAYSDSLTDLPVLSCSRKAVLVNAGAGIQGSLERRLNPQTITTVTPLVLHASSVMSKRQTTVFTKGKGDGQSVDSGQRHAPKGSDWHRQADLREWPILSKTIVVNVHWV